MDPALWTVEEYVRHGDRMFDVRATDPQTGFQVCDFSIYAEDRLPLIRALLLDNERLTKPEVCSHGKGLTDYCEPCGRIHGEGE